VVQARLRREKGRVPGPRRQREEELRGWLSGYKGDIAVIKVKCEQGKLILLFGCFAKNCTVTLQPSIPSPTQHASHP
jgi:hypothetical protein